mmetsp:Transcript_19412/g.27319  ORF Transcript_19412/g.27319 Transcript_19412/m.27319 type:complete len:93 (+) Transcript_19412:1505-1783(+)
MRPKEHLWRAIKQINREIHAMSESSTSLTLSSESVVNTSPFRDKKNSKIVMVILTHSRTPSKVKKPEIILSSKTELKPMQLPRAIKSPLYNP